MPDDARIAGEIVANRCPQCGGSGGSCILIHDGSEHSREACRGAQWRDCPHCDGTGVTPIVTDADLHKLNRAVRDALYALQVADTQLAGIFGYPLDDPIRARRIAIAKRCGREALEAVRYFDG